MRKSFLFAIAVLSIQLFTSCQKDNIEVILEKQIVPEVIPDEEKWGSLSLGFNTASSSDKTDVPYCSDKVPTTLVYTIVGGEESIEEARAPITVTDNAFVINENIQLKEGDYEITELYLLSEDGTVVYAVAKGEKSVPYTFYDYGNDVPFLDTLPIRISIIAGNSVSIVFHAVCFEPLDLSSTIEYDGTFGVASSVYILNKYESTITVKMKGEVLDVDTPLYTYVLFAMNDHQPVPLVEHDQTLLVSIYDADDRLIMSYQEHNDGHDYNINSCNYYNKAGEVIRSSDKHEDWNADGTTTSNEFIDLSILEDQ